MMKRTSFRIASKLATVPGNATAWKPSDVIARSTSMNPCTATFPPAPNPEPLSATF